VERGEPCKGPLALTPEVDLVVGTCPHGRARFSALTLRALHSYLTTLACRAGRSSRADLSAQPLGAGRSLQSSLTFGSRGSGHTLRPRRACDVPIYVAPISWTLGPLRHNSQSACKIGLAGICLLRRRQSDSVSAPARAATLHRVGSCLSSTGVSLPPPGRGTSAPSPRPRRTLSDGLPTAGCKRL
jgi:hypothetical protein